MKLSYPRIFPCLLVGAIWLFLFLPDRAAAHLVSTGMGPVYDGIGHLLLTPEDIIPTVAVAFFAGLRGPATGRLLLFTFPIAWMIGGIIGLQGDFLPTFPMAAGSYIVLGLLVALDLNITPVLFAALAALIALLHGYLNGVVLSTGPGIAGLFGIMAALFVLLALGSAAVLLLKAVWMRIVVRVVGSWIAAIGILMVGWHYAGNLR